MCLSLKGHTFVTIILLRYQTRLVLESGHWVFASSVPFAGLGTQAATPIVIYIILSGGFFFLRGGGQEFHSLSFCVPDTEKSEDSERVGGVIKLKLGLATSFCRGFILPRHIMYTNFFFLLCTSVSFLGGADRHLSRWLNSALILSLFLSFTFLV